MLTAPAGYYWGLLRKKKKETNELLLNTCGEFGGTQKSFQLEVCGGTYGGGKVGYTCLQFGVIVTQ